MTVESLCPGRFFVHKSVKILVCFQAQLVQCCGLSVFLYCFEVYIVNFSKTVGNVYEVLNFNGLFFKINQFVCN